MKKTPGYKRRLQAEPSRDRYGSFKDGIQKSSDTIAGRHIWHQWKSVPTKV